MNRIWLGMIALPLLVAAAVSVTRAQAPAPAAMTTSDAAVAALVSEVRALRTELTQLAGASVRSQLIVTRIQLQEQRLLHLDRQRAETASKLAEAEKGRAAFAMQLKMFENPDKDTPEPQRREMGGMIGGMRAQLQTAEAGVAALRSEQDNLLNALSTEQSRWNDFNGRLDDLERSLPRSTGR